MKTHYYDSQGCNLYSEKLSLCGISGYQTVGIPQDDGTCTIMRRGNGLIFAKGLHVSCKNCRRIMLRRDIIKPWQITP